MRLSRVVMTATVCAVAWAGLGSDPASAQALIQRKVYAAKFLCGEVKPTPGLPPELIPVKPGNYLTAINVHNPTRLPLTLVKKAVLIFNAQQPTAGFEVPMPPRQRFSLSLNPDWGFEVDCRDIRAMLLGGIAPFPTFIKGWVVFETFQQGQELDVVTAYTSHGFVTDASGVTVPEGFSTEVETVLGKIVP
jgi:hypothetical protein